MKPNRSSSPCRPPNQMMQNPSSSNTIFGKIPNSRSDAEGKMGHNQKSGLDNSGYGFPTPSINVTLHFDGTFHHTARCSKYIGGRQVLINNVKKDVFTYHILRSVITNEGVRKPLRLYNDVTGGFVLRGDDKDLSDLFDETFKEDGSLSLYVDELNESVGTEQGDGNGNENVDGEGDLENECSGDTDDVHFNLEDDVQLQDNLDDKWFDKYVDLDVEWFQGFSTERENQKNSIVQEEEGSDDDSSEEDVVINDVELHSGKDSDDDDDEEVNHKFPFFSPTDLYDPEFQLGMHFENNTILRKAIHSHAVRTNRNIDITKNDKERVHAKCSDVDCEWLLHGLIVPGDTKFQIRKYKSVHTCAKSFHVKNMRADWISGKYLSKFKSDPKRSVKGFREDVIAENQCQVSEDQAYRAKRKALTIIQGDFVDQYSLLWDFIEEVKRSNPGSTIILKTEDVENEEPRFDKLYMCLDALKKGFLNGCRPFLGLDGCHLTGPHRGVLLSAVAVDPNNNIFPIAIAVVTKEDRNSWEWFLTLLKVDLNITEDYLWTFMSDKQKGLIRAMSEVFPNATHRFCVQHLLRNFRSAGFTGHDLKSALWNAARALTPNEFEARMTVMKDLKKETTEWLEDKPPEQWSKAYFNDIPKVDTLLNNGCESFNAAILKARDMSIVSMLEWILEYLMKRMRKNRARCGKQRWKGPVCPKIQKILNKASDKVGDCIPVKADKFHYQINCFDSSRYAVDLEKGTCGCRDWDISGIPCKHALSAIYNEKLSCHDFVNDCYKVDTYKKVYAPVIKPINGRSEWRATGFIPPQPPNDGIRGVGRPEKVRRKGNDEPSQKMKKRSRGKPKGKDEQILKRHQDSIKCGKFGSKGHNRKTCHQHETPNDQPEQQEEIVLSQYMVSQCSEFGGSGSQLHSQAGESSRPSKLKVTRKEGAKKNCLMSAPTPYEQFEQCHVQTEKGPSERIKKKYKALSQL